MRLTLCGRGVELSAGDHTLRSAVGRDEGIDVDRLVLSSRAADGRQVPVVSDDDAAGEPSGPAGPRSRSRSRAARRRPSRSRPRDEPTWFVLGQSNSPGWQATVGGTRPRPTDGHRRVRQRLAAAGRSRSPHRRAALDPAAGRVRRPRRCPALAVIACLVVVVIGLRRRATATGRHPHAGRRPAGRLPPVGPVALGRRAAVGAGHRRHGPRSATGDQRRGDRTRRPAIVVGAATLAVLRVRRARALTVLGPAVALAISGLYTIVSQARHNLPGRVRVAQLLPEGAPGRLRGRRAAPRRRGRRPALDRPLVAAGRGGPHDGPVSGLEPTPSCSASTSTACAGTTPTRSGPSSPPSGASTPASLGPQLSWEFEEWGVRARGVRPLPPGRRARAPHLPDDGRRSPARPRRCGGCPTPGCGCGSSPTGCA